MQITLPRPQWLFTAGHTSKQLQVATAGQQVRDHPITTDKYPTLSHCPQDVFIIILLLVTFTKEYSISLKSKNQRATKVGMVWGGGGGHVMRRGHCENHCLVSLLREVIKMEIQGRLDGTMDDINEKELLLLGCVGGIIIRAYHHTSTLRV